MMKSLFAKYITAVAVILLVSFLMLSSIISVSIDDFATEARRDDVLLISTIAAAVIEEVRRFLSVISNFNPNLGIWQWKNMQKAT